MKKLLVCLVSLILATLPLVGCAESFPQKTKQSVVSLTNGLGSPVCTGVAIGKQLVWTKAHCLEDGMPSFNNVVCPVNVVVAEDGADNVLVSTPCQFYRRVAKIASKPPMPGDVAYLWGHGMGLPLMFRSGIMIGEAPVDDGMGSAWLFDFVSAPGDSGGPIFNKKGEVLCTMKGQLIHHVYPNYIPYCIPHRFTPDQLKGNL